MKFPTVTVALVSAALIYVVWYQYQNESAPLNAERFGNLSAEPIERSEVLDWVSGQVPQLCMDATGKAENSEVVADCIARSDKLQSTCRRMAYEQFPETIASDRVFQDLSLVMMECLVRDSRRLQ